VSRLHTSMLLFQVLRQEEPVRTHPILFRYVFILFPYLSLGIPRGLQLSGFRPKICKHSQSNRIFGPHSDDYEEFCYLVYIPTKSKVKNSKAMPVSGRGALEMCFL
jgi:hypothetical protein